MELVPYNPNGQFILFIHNNNNFIMPKMKKIYFSNAI